MRAAFGLVSLLVCALIILWVYSQYTVQVASSGTAAREQAEQIAGVDSSLGGRTSDHIGFDAYYQGSKLQSMQVKRITPGSSFQTYYGLQANDYIDQIGPQSVKDVGDAEMAKALAIEAYQRKWDLGIWRNGKHFMLPEQKAIAAPAAAISAVPGLPANSVQPIPAQPAAQPAQPAQPAKQAPYVSPLQRQLDAITNHGQ
jgi:hypothetical protein